MSNIQLLNEDNMVVMARYPDKHFDLAIVDPPYGISADDNSGRGNRRSGKSCTISKFYEKKGWDSKPAYKDFFIELKRVSKNQIIWGANHFIENIPSANSSSWIVWDKDNGDNDYADCELAYTSFKSPVRKVKFKWQGMLQADMKNKEVRIHPTQKPVKLYQWQYDNYAKPDFKIIDTHLGSGSNAIASHQFGIAEFVGCEIDKDYYDAAVKRFNLVTSQTSLFKSA